MQRARNLKREMNKQRVRNVQNVWCKVLAEREKRECEERVERTERAQREGRAERGQRKGTSRGPAKI